MRRLIVAFVAALVLVPLPCQAQSIPSDKAQHIGACYAVELVLAEVKPFRKWKPWQRVLFTTAIIGGAKEWYDHKHPNSHSAEWGDIGADFVGAAAAEGTLWLVHKTW